MAGVVGPLNITTLSPGNTSEGAILNEHPWSPDAGHPVASSATSIERTFREERTLVSVDTVIVMVRKRATA
jgi:hypothetical protein